MWLTLESNYIHLAVRISCQAYANKTVGLSHYLRHLSERPLCFLHSTINKSTLWPMIANSPNSHSITSRNIDKSNANYYDRDKLIWPNDQKRQYRGRLLVSTETGRERRLLVIPYHNILEANFNMFIIHAKCSTDTSSAQIVGHYPMKSQKELTWCLMTCDPEVCFFFRKDSITQQNEITRSKLFNNK